ncbi:MarR family winged helix-turn-helix transcriptional regulator [Pelagibius sp. Alg239-R121]|uniref:MarR family winged helix-turn-helix transcriptional regulator n=1 Tax=Pelagibius sp. Alg239-R121 TaxID=2993448 RepID=UPI0024A6D3DA|nr:MarR family transcriptional regulator [Pelagibius sp. Alg239-R121]
MQENLDQRRSRLIGRLVTRLSMAYQRRLEERGNVSHNLPPAQKSLLVHIEAEGSRVTALAERLRISKQAVSKLVQELEAQGYVTRQPDETDGRAMRVCFTRRGRDLVQDTVSVFEALDQEAVKVLGKQDAAALRSLLERWAAHLDPKAF